MYLCIFTSSHKAIMKSFTTLLAAGLFLLSDAQAQVNPYGDPLSYGGSPEVLPSPMGTGNGGGSRWAAAYSQAVALVAQMTNEEKVKIQVQVFQGSR
jgi:hypothetical protein